MESLIFSLNVSLPVVLTILFGFFLGKKQVLTPAFDEAASTLVFDYAYPCSLFASIAACPIKELLNIKLILFATLAETTAFVIALAIVPLIIKDTVKSSTMVQGMIRTNFLLQGLPVALYMYGTQGAAPAYIILPFCITINTLVSHIVFLVLLPNDSANGARNLGRAVTKAFKSPLVVASLAGVIAAFLPFELPVIAMRTLESIGKIAGPLALLILGSRFELKSLKTNLKYTLPSSFIRVIVVPLFITTAAILLGFRGNALGCLFVLNGASTASISFMTAKSMGGDADMAGQIVGITSAASAFTIFFGIFALRSMGYI